MVRSRPPPGQSDTATESGLTYHRRRRLAPQVGSQIPKITDIGIPGRAARFSRLAVLSHSPHSAFSGGQGKRYRQGRTDVEIEYQSVQHNTSGHKPRPPSMINSPPTVNAASSEARNKIA